MIRIISSAIGAAFVFVLAIALFGSIKGQITDPVKATAVDDFHLAPKEVELKSNGYFGTFDKRQLQRGLQVYKEVCSACHSLSHVAFRDLKELGYNDAQVKKFAADWQLKAQTFDDKSGDRGERPNVPSDHFPKVYYPGTGSPPDLSLITKAREEGPAYVHSLLTGYTKEPAALLAKYPDSKTPDGLYYNPYFANLNIAMPPPLTQDGQVTYLDGTKSTVDQMAKDVTAFLVWTAEPNLETRHDAGFAAGIFLLIFCFLAWGAYQNVWRDVKH
ncbi:cytochrome c1 [Sphingomonas oligophenolica]|uniref:Cytochrome c1 n=1 Tax=Sphingomonas oligophenolica TaxID=301154 RepID=A0ABU9XYX5_9SPHN